MCKKICKICFEEFNAHTTGLYCDECKNKKHYCLCGCGEEIISGVNIKYKKGHARKGRKNSEYHNKRISEYHKEKIISEETKIKISQSHIGLKRSSEVKKKMSEIAKQKQFGKWMIGKHLSKEIIEKMVKTRSSWYIMSEETKQKIKIKALERWKDKEKRQKYLNLLRSDEHRLKQRRATLKVMSINKTHNFYNTKPEQEMEKILTDLNIKFEKQKPIKDILHCYPCDFYLSDYNLIVEVDGGYWHNYPNYTELDKIREKELSEQNYKITRFWENEINLDNVKSRFVSLNILKEA